MKMYGATEAGADAAPRKPRTLPPGSRRRRAWHVAAPAGLLAAGFLFGGTAGYYPLGEMVLGVAGVTGLLAYAISFTGRPPPHLAAAGVAAILFLPIAQLIPLPPSIWQAIPGSALATASRDAVGASSGWWPVSIDSEATIRWAVATLAPIAMFLLTLRLSEASLRWLLAYLVVLALASLVLGFVQLATQQPSVYFFRNAHFGLPLGVFANRNHQALFLAVGAATAGVLSLSREDGGGGPRRVLYGAASVALAGGVIATGSRAGSALLLLCALLGTAAAQRERRNAKRVLAGLALLGVASVMLMQTGAGQFLAARLESTDEHARADNWQTAMAALKAHLPLGTGMGSFVPVNAANEPLAHVSSHYANRAHNDYLELGIEAGLIGLGAALLGWVSYIVAVSRLLRPRGAIAPINAAAALGVGAAMLHSIVDYPLRVPLLGLEFAMLAAILLRGATLRSNLSQHIDFIEKDGA